MRAHIECLIEKCTRRVPRGQRWQVPGHRPVVWVQVLTRLWATGARGRPAPDGCSPVAKTLYATQTDM